MELVNNLKTLYGFFLCLGYGMGIGCGATLLSLWQKHKKHSPLRIAINNISLYFWSAIGLFLLSLSLTDGRPRLWLFLGTAIGTFGWNRFFASPVSRLIGGIHRRMTRLRRTIVQHFAPIGLMTRKKMKKSENFFKKLLKFKRVILYNVSK